MYVVYVDVWVGCRVRPYLIHWMLESRSGVRIPTWQATVGTVYCGIDGHEIPFFGLF